jgi:hypothetical protein
MLIAAVVPSNACEINVSVVLLTRMEQQSPKLYVCSLLNSFGLDWIIRYKISMTGAEHVLSVPTAFAPPQS